jgi:hypothetical protein
MGDREVSDELSMERVEKESGVTNFSAPEVIRTFTEAPASINLRTRKRDL